MDTTCSPSTKAWQDECPTCEASKEVKKRLEGQKSIDLDESGNTKLAYLPKISNSWRL